MGSLRHRAERHENAAVPVKKTQTQTDADQPLRNEVTGSSKSISSETSKHAQAFPAVGPPHQRRGTDESPQASSAAAAAAAAMINGDQVATDKLPDRPLLNGRTFHHGGDPLHVLGSGISTPNHPDAKSEAARMSQDRHPAHVACSSNALPSSNAFPSSVGAGGLSSSSAMLRQSEPFLLQTSAVPLAPPSHTSYGIPYMQPGFPGEDPARAAKQLAIAQIQGMSLQMPSSRTCLMDDSTAGGGLFKHHRPIKQEGMSGLSMGSQAGDHPHQQQAANQSLRNFPAHVRKRSRFPGEDPPSRSLDESKPAKPSKGDVRRSPGDAQAPQAAGQSGAAEQASQAKTGAAKQMPLPGTRPDADSAQPAAAEADHAPSAAIPSRPQSGSSQQAASTRAGRLSRDPSFERSSRPGSHAPSLERDRRRSQEPSPGDPGQSAADPPNAPGNVPKPEHGSGCDGHEKLRTDTHGSTAEAALAGTREPSEGALEPARSRPRTPFADARPLHDASMVAELDRGNNGAHEHAAKKRKLEEQQSPPEEPQGPVPMLVEAEPEEADPDQKPRDGSEQKQHRRGHRCSLYWPLDDEWYAATVHEHDAKTARHRIVYEADGQEEWISLRAEGKAGRLRWAGIAPTHSPATTKTPVLPRRPDSGLASGRASPADPASDSQHDRESQPQGMEAVGMRIGVFWPADGCFYSGTVSSFDEPSGCHCIAYDDNENDWLHLANEKVRWLDRERPQAERPATPSMAEQPESKPSSEADTAEQGKKAVAKGDLPARVPCLCNGLRGEFDIAKACVILEGRECTPTEFERLAGKASSKKWKSSLRIDKGGGIPGRTMGDWLVEAGIDEARAARPRAPTLDAVRRRQGAAKQKSSLLGSDRPHGAQAHREGCLCVICKQSRRSGRSWAGMAGSAGGRPVSTGKPTLWLPSSGGAGGQPPMPIISAPRGAHLGPRTRFGKRAFVLATPHLAAGSRCHQLAEVPESRMWEPAEWDQAHAPAPKPAPEEAAPSTASKAKAAKVEAPAPPAPKGRPPPTARGTPSSGDQPRTGKPSRGGNTRFVRLGEIAKSDAMDAEPASERLGTSRSSPSSPWQSQAAQVSDAVLDADACNQVENAVAAGIVPGAKAAAAKQQAKGQTLKERLAACRASERERLAFGKSGIHGWGLFARKALKQDSMIIEYRGDVVTRTVSELREHKYRAAGIDCYLFNINDELVVDATMRGTIGRFTNHCCSPSMYTKVLELDGQPHLVFFARADVKPGQELTYDYRFKEEEGASKLPCMCGAPNCRQTLN